MWIESIDLNDFGHFNRARLSGIDDGLTVIAGPQRAGKTTFMEAVRYLGYGLTSGTNVPPATDQYDIAATVVKDGFRYELILEGYATPTVTKLDDDAPDQSARELFGNMRKTQYQQLYTVSLDELSRNPDSLDDDVDLSNVLLEAASGGDITDVPDIRDDFAKRAKGIGGLHGRKSYDLKDPLNTIQAGIEERDDATAQVAEYEEKEAEKQAVEERIDEIDREIDSKEMERMRLEAVVSGHDTYQDLQRCISKLESKDINDIERFPTNYLDEAISIQEQLQTEYRELREVVKEFESAVDTANPELYREHLIDAKSSIEQFDHEQSGWEQRLETLCEKEESLEETHQDLKQTAANLSPDWNSEPIDIVRSLDTDLFSQDAVNQAVEQYQSAEDDVIELSQTIDELKERHGDLEDRIKNAVEIDKETSPRDIIPVIAAGSVFALVAGGVLAVGMNPLVGVTITTLILLVTGSYAFSRINSETPVHRGVSVDTLRAEAEKIESELEAKQERLNDRQEKLADAEATLNKIQETYNLPEGVSATVVRRFHSNLVDVKKQLAEYETARDRFKEDIGEFRDELEHVVQTLANIGITENSIDDPIEDAPKVFAAIDRAVNHLEYAEDVQKADQSVCTIEEDVVTILSEWNETASVDVTNNELVDELNRFIEHGERVREYQTLQESRDEVQQNLLNQLSVQAYAEALTPLINQEEYDDNEWLIKAYEEVLNKHGNIDNVRERHDALESAIERLEDEKESCREDRTELEQELQNLASDTDVREAHETIERGRRNLEPLAEEYATHRIAEYLLDELHERFIERTTGPLLAEASDIFQRITGGTYTEINTRNEFDDLDFEAALKDGGIHRTSELSRATAEQLFLAVRLARIKRYEEPLPVLLDDSLTNFDPEHVQRTLDVVCELANEVQVFLLTCHPPLLDRIADSYDAQYWYLRDGAFDGPHWSNDPIQNVFEQRESEPQVHSEL